MATADSQFEFLRGDWPMLFEPAAQAESLAIRPAGPCFHARRALELAVHWLYKHDAALKLPYQEKLSALIHAPSFRTPRPGDLRKSKSSRISATSPSIATKR